MYKVLIDYGTEGMKFMDIEFTSVDEAVKGAVALNSAFPFLIVKVIDWEAYEVRTGTTSSN